MVLLIIYIPCKVPKSTARIDCGFICCLSTSMQKANNMYIVHMRHYTIVKLALSVIVLLPNGTLLRESADDV